MWARYQENITSQSHMAFNKTKQRFVQLTFHQSAFITGHVHKSQAKWKEMSKSKEDNFQESGTERHEALGRNWQSAQHSKKPRTGRNVTFYS